MESIFRITEKPQKYGIQSPTPLVVKRLLNTSLTIPESFQTDW
ncbi:hypothetical protein FHS27_004802 [Rhodopirellula rubra]|uniref:Uncharacterized protein n=1 Tax=Aporhodopirellula rubra TaxID=980271 RepID=A0A7W5E2L5_9BACT|nr:hypothetical protein [Aporhodopirellula rubra]